MASGQWLSAYDGVVTTDPHALEIDHVVALKEAWDSGAFAWDAARLEAYANDVTDRRTLAAVTTASNQAKSDRDPSTWLPPLVTDQCTYLGDWIAIKARWGLSMDDTEAARLRSLLEGQCAGLTIAAFSPPPSAL